LLNCDRKTLRNGIKKLQSVGKISQINDGRIKIINWDKYQTRYQKYYKKSAIQNEEKQHKNAKTPGIDMPDREEVEEKEINAKAAQAALPSKHFSNKIDANYLEPLLDIAKKIQGKSSNGKKAFNFYQWIQIHIKKKSHPAAMIKAGNALYDYWDTVNNPRGYLDGIMTVENANANERDHIQTHEALKAEWRAWERSPAAQKISKILQKLARAP